MTEKVSEEGQGAQTEYVGKEDAYVPKTQTKNKVARWIIFVISKHILSAHCGLYNPQKIWQYIMREIELMASENELI